jgi:hypothetical protein
VAIPGAHRGDQRRPAWARLLWAPVPVLGPVVVPVLLLAAVLGYSVARDAEPSGLGEPATGLVPGATTVTEWEQDASLVPAGFGPRDPGHASPRALVDAMVADAGRAADGQPWITGAIVAEEEDAARARVYLPTPEYPDTFVAAELLLEVALEPDGWHVDDAHVRFHCRRTVRNGLCA